MAKLWNEMVTLYTGDGDPRTQGWLFTDARLLMYLTTIYLGFVFRIGPKYMKNRPAYDLRTYIVVYNVIQIFGCAALLYGYIRYGAIDLNNLFRCTTFKLSFEDNSIQLPTVMWYYTIFKLLEYTETVVFILRKKYDQVSGLHVYHHVSTLFFSWIGLRFLPGGIGAFVQGTNCFIHILMYSYYLLSVYVSPKAQKKIKKWKKYLTILQMVQFSLMIIHASQSFFVERCSNYGPGTILFLPSIIYVFYLFKVFFDKSYRGSVKQKTTKTIKNNVS